jgi:hypothetical protein
MRSAQIGAIRKCVMLPGFEFDSHHSPPKNGINSCVFLKSLISADVFQNRPNVGNFTLLLVSIAEQILCHL